MKFILGKKLGMTQIFREDGSVVPVTKIQAGPCVVTEVKTKENGLNSVQVSFGEKKLFRLNKAEQGQLKGLPPAEVKRDFNLDKENSLKFGDYFTVSIFAPGEKVKVTGESKGRGFQGVVKRHGFSGSLASHGHKDQLRMPGSIGSTGPQRVFKGTRMAGHMGNEQVTVDNLEIVGVNEENNELLLKGAIPGARGSLITIMGTGAFEPAKNLLEKEELVEETKEEKPAVEEASQEETVLNTDENVSEAPEVKEESVDDLQTKEA